MKVDFEIILPDEGSSFRLLHTKTNPGDYPWQYHYHPEYEIVCVPQGNGTRHVGNHFSSYENGDLVFIGPNLPHAGFGLNACGPHEEIVIQVKEEVFQSILSRPEMVAIGRLLEKTKHGVYFTGNTKRLLTKKLKSLLKLSLFERFLEFVSILQIMAISEEYGLLNPDDTLALMREKNNTRLQSIFSYVESNFNEEMNIKKVASIANLSVPSFCNYFKRIMSCTFTEFVNQYRIQKACMLMQHEKTINEISFECGFNSVAYFNKVFKAITKKTPSQYKRETQKNWVKLVA